jgi:hypothetical protein
VQLLVKDTAQRMRLEEVASHPWVLANADAAQLGAQ